MQVLEEDHDGGALAEPAQQLVHHLAGSPLQRLGVEAEVRHPGSFADREPEPGGQGLDGPSAVVTGAGVLPEPGPPLLGDGVRVVAVVDAEPLDEDAAQQRVGGHLLGRRRRPAPQQPDAVGEAGQVALEVPDEACLADAGVAEHGDDERRPVGGDVGEQLLQLAELETAADGRRGDALDAARLQPEPLDLTGHDEEAVDRLVEPLQRQPGHQVQLERAPDVTAGVGRHQDPAGRRRCLDAGGAVDPIADHDQVAVAPLPQGPDHHLAGVDAHPHRQLDAEAGVEAAVELLERRPHREGGAHRPVRVVLVGPPEPEHRHHRVTDVLLDDSALGLDGDAPGGEVVVHDLADVLGVELPREHGEVDDIGEQDRDQLALLARRGRTGAGPASPPTAGGRCRPRRPRARLRCSSSAVMARSTAVSSSTVASPGPNLPGRVANPRFQPDRR